MAEINEVVVVGMARTPIGRYLGGLAGVRANDLAITAATAAIERAGIEPGIIDEIVGATCLHAGNGSLPPRIIAMKVGLPIRSAACMVAELCFWYARHEIACRNIMLGKTDISLVTAVESMSNIPTCCNRPALVTEWAMAKCRMPCCRWSGMSAGWRTHGNDCGKYCRKIRYHSEECDALALTSHQNAVKAVDEGIFDREIVPGNKEQERREGYFQGRASHQRSQPGNHGQVAPAFKRRSGNCGQCLPVSMTAQLLQYLCPKEMRRAGTEALDETGWHLQRRCSTGSNGTGSGCSHAQGFKQAGWKYEDVDYWEVNEAFAAQVLGVVRMLKEEAGIELDFSKTNHNGSGIGLGHPVGATGLRIIVSMYYELERLGLTKGGASLCAAAPLWLLSGPEIYKYSYLN